MHVQDGSSYLSQIVPNLKIWRVLYCELHRYASEHGLKIDIMDGPDVSGEVLPVAQVEKMIREEYKRQAKEWQYNV